MNDEMVTCLAPWSAYRVEVSEACAAGGDGQCDGGDGCECPCHERNWWGERATTAEVEKWHRVLWSVPSEEARREAVAAAEAAFWATLAGKFPEVTTGDLDPSTATHLGSVMARTLDGWLEGNHPGVALVDSLNDF